MIRSTATTTIRRCLSQHQPLQQRVKSTAPLQGDTGNLATHIHHKMTAFLAVATPVYLLMPDTTTNDMVDKSIGTILAVNIGAHSWIGLNYVVTDYVPKVTKALVGPARIVSAGIGAVTVVGLTKVSFNDKGGIKGVLKALWK